MQKDKNIPSFFLGTEGFTSEIEDELKNYFEVLAKNIMKKDTGKRISCTREISYKNTESLNFEAGLLEDTVFPCKTHGECKSRPVVVKPPSLPWQSNAEGPKVANEKKPLRRTKTEANATSKMLGKATVGGKWFSSKQLPSFISPQLKPKSKDNKELGMVGKQLTVIGMNATNVENGNSDFELKKVEKVAVTELDKTLLHLKAFNENGINKTKSKTSVFLPPKIKNKKPKTLKKKNNHIKKKVTISKDVFSTHTLNNSSKRHSS